MAEVSDGELLANQHEPRQIMWPSFESRPGEALSVEQRIERANVTIKLPGIGAIVVTALAGLIIGVMLRLQGATEQDGWRGFLPAMVMFGSLGLGFTLAWAWHTLTIPRWWDWAVTTGVDFDELVAAATAAGLISHRESWWQERPSTLRARQHTPRGNAHHAADQS